MSIFLARLWAFLGMRGVIALGFALALALAMWRIGALEDKLADARETIASLLDWQTEMVDAVRLASDNPDVDSTTAKAQVQELGTIRLELTNAVEMQNAALDEMERQSAEAFRLAQEAERKRRAVLRRNEQLQAELRAKARVPAPAADMERAVRRTQDELFEEGL